MFYGTPPYRGETTGRREEQIHLHHPATATSTVRGPA